MGKQQGYVYKGAATNISIYLEQVVIDGVDSLAEAHGLRRSPMVNVMLRKMMGMPVVEYMKLSEGDKE